MSSNDQYLELTTDVLVIGSGGAALRAAIAADSLGANVLVAVKGKFARSGATYSSVAEIGAFNVPDGAADPEDSPLRFFEDIVARRHGKHLSEHLTWHKRAVCTLSGDAVNIYQSI